MYIFDSLTLMFGLLNTARNTGSGIKLLIVRFKKVKIPGRAKTKKGYLLVDTELNQDGVYCQNRFIKTISATGKN